ncbi:upf0041-domain-containing protein [Ceraceosorus bombacis]|uniref:Mitochondrial pyruvate carrier n=1 Tax=Ceraceosorus bombacis TaxID=401625 RepID=A0A0P1B9C3_9BASI|nr:upf0041-domain-containing protein [Ceraceosorus bombacis]
MASAAGAGASSRFGAFMNHPAGPKTVFFWAPIMKWGLVIAGLKDLNRPADKLSLFQNAALAATGMIWVRYSLVITPVNYSLAAVNFFPAPILDAAKDLQQDAKAKLEQTGKL